MRIIGGTLRLEGQTYATGNDSADVTPGRVPQLQVAAGPLASLTPGGGIYRFTEHAHRLAGDSGGTVTVGGVEAFVCNKLRKTERQVKQHAPASTRLLAFMHCELAANCGAGGDALLRHPILLKAMEGAYAASTVATHRPYIAKYIEHCNAHGISVFPPSPFVVAVWIAEAAAGDDTISPTDHRISAIVWLANCTKHVFQRDDIVLSLAYKGLTRQLGHKKESKAPLLQGHVQTLYDAFAAPLDAPLANVLRIFQLTLMYEGALRFDDIQSSCFGAIVVSRAALRVFLIATKTDRQACGQWATIPMSSAPSSAAQLLGRLVGMLDIAWAGLSPDRQSALGGVLGAMPLESMPLLPRWSEQDSFPCSSGEPESYDAFRGDLKRMLNQIGLDERLFGTHSFRRGRITDADAVGVADSVKMQMGRWRSEKMLAVYIDCDRSLHEMLTELSKLQK